MGIELVVPRAAAPSIAAIIARLAAVGVSAGVMMVDGQLWSPSMPVSNAWSDLRLRTSAGTVTLRRLPDGIAVVVFANADDALIKAQQTVATAIRDA